MCGLSWCSHSGLMCGLSWCSCGGLMMIVVVVTTVVMELMTLEFVTEYILWCDFTGFCHSRYFY